MNRKSVLVGVLSAFVVVGIVAFNSAHTYFGRENAKELIRLMYDFNKVEEIDTRYGDIKKLTSESVYKQLTSMDRTLRAYLRMEGNGAEVHIIRESDEYIIFEIETPSLTQGRKFMLLYEAGITGKIVEAKEVEIVDFI